MENQEFNILANNLDLAHRVEELFNEPLINIYSSNNSKRCRDILNNHAIDLVLLKCGTGNMGLCSRQQLIEMAESAYLIIITDFQNIDFAVQAIKLGASDYLTEPVDNMDLKERIEDIRREQKLSFSNKAFDKELDRISPTAKIIHQNHKMHKAIDLVYRNRNNNLPVFIQGETGTRKSLLAYTLHRISARNDKSLIHIDCTKYYKSISEQPTFIYKFDKLHQNTSFDRLEDHDSPTLFLNNLAEMPFAMQRKFYTILEEKDYLENTNIKLISATDRRVNELIDQDSFYSRLLYRINTITVTIPPLRERPEDLVQYANYFVNKHAGNHKKEIQGISPRAMDKLFRYDFPGNIIELENIIERAVILSINNVINAEDIILNNAFNDGENSNRNLLKNLNLAPTKDKTCLVNFNF